MKKKHLAAEKINETIGFLRAYRTSWAHQIREDYQCAMPEALSILFTLYQLSGCILLELEQEQAQSNYRHDRIAMLMVRKQLVDVVKSPIFSDFACMADAGVCYVVSTATRHHIRVMFEILDELGA